MRYYKSDKKVADLTELAEILAADETESLTLGSEDHLNADGTINAETKKMIYLNRVISDKDLDLILDRSPAAFEKRKLNGSSSDLTLDSTTDAASGSASAASENALFKEVEESDHRDESNDILSSSNMKK
jgi:hypothetical protein